MTGCRIMEKAISFRSMARWPTSLPRSSARGPGSAFLFYILKPWVVGRSARPGHHEVHLPVPGFVRAGWDFGLGAQGSVVGAQRLLRAWRKGFVAQGDSCRVLNRGLRYKASGILWLAQFRAQVGRGMYPKHW